MWLLTLSSSLPVRGAWIEIAICLACAAASMSLPVRGAWIEIKLNVDSPFGSSSLPVRGAWIEICRVHFIMDVWTSRSL